MTVAIADAVAATETPSPVSTSSNVAATKRVVRRSRGQTPARFTVELPRPQHRFLKRFALNEDSDASSVVRALLTLLKEERAVADAVSAMKRGCRGGSAGRCGWRILTSSCPTTCATPHCHTPATRRSCGDWSDA